MERPEQAVILAAGRGRRLGDLAHGRPKGFLQVAGETLIGRSLRLLAERGVRRVVLVAGYRAGAYHELAEGHPLLEVVENPDYDRTESMGSLACALERVAADFVLLESDLFYEARALDALLACDGADAVLGSGRTGAGDEVWLEGRGPWLHRLSKRRADLASVQGELVGVSKVSHALAKILASLYRESLARGEPRMSYDTDALDVAVRRHPVELCVVPDLLWGEVDYAHHWQRVTREIGPAVEWLESGAAAAVRPPRSGTPSGTARPLREAAWPTLSPRDSS